MPSKGSVLVAMSGGVDSSVAACLLADQGYEVFGSHMNLVHLDGVEHGCCGPSARADAEAVARVAGFPFEIADHSEEFAETVIAEFVEEHAAGRTPNPCATCNGQIKFGAFLRRADQLGMDFVATGHYVRTSQYDDGRWHLLRGADASKDQTLHAAHAGPGPAGAVAVPRRRPAEGGDPQARGSVRAAGGGQARFPGAVLRAERRRRRVRAVDRARAWCGAVARWSIPTGTVLGEHDGTFAFTIGQRRGLGVAIGEPAYVLDVDATANRVVVGPQVLLARRGLVADRASWVAGEPPTDGPFEAQVRIRYQGEDAPAVVEPTAGGFRVEFREPQRAVAPGQSAVVYRGDEVLGGGRIVESLR